jgi:hypothetical protein
MGLVFWHAMGALNLNALNQIEWCWRLAFEFCLLQPFS